MTPDQKSTAVIRRVLMQELRLCLRTRREHLATLRRPDSDPDSLRAEATRQASYATDEMLRPRHRRPFLGACGIADALVDPRILDSDPCARAQWDAARAAARLVIDAASPVNVDCTGRVMGSAAKY